MGTLSQSNEYSTFNTNTKDQRHTVRYSLTGTVQFRWRADGRRHHGVGIVRDIGKGGIFIESDTLPILGSPITLLVMLPYKSTPLVMLQLSGSGYVRHVRQSAYPKRGFGVAADFRVDLSNSTGNAKVEER